MLTIRPFQGAIPKLSSDLSLVIRVLRSLKKAISLRLSLEIRLCLLTMRPLQKAISLSLSLVIRI